MEAKPTPQAKQRPTGKPVKVLVLCHGSICRSPLAGAILMRELGADQVRIRACKIYDPKRKAPPAAKKVREFAAGLGLDLGFHRAQSAEAEDASWADLILYMDGGNRERMKEFVDEHNDKKCKCLGSYIGKDRIPDPNYTKRGEGLNMILNWVVVAAESFARSIKNPSV